MSELLRLRGCAWTATIYTNAFSVECGLCRSFAKTVCVIVDPGDAEGSVLQVCGDCMRKMTSAMESAK